MVYERCIFGSLAAVYCLFLGIFALIHGRHNPTNRYFAYFQFNIVIANLSEFVVLFSDPHQGIWFLRITRIGSCFMIPFFIHFIYTLFELNELPWGRRTIQIFYALAGVFAFLHLTPHIYKSVYYDSIFGTFLMESMGPAFILFAIYLVLGASAAMIPLPAIIRTRSGVKRLQAFYILGACGIGLAGLMFFVFSFYKPGLPRTYYPIEAIISFIFSYAIFKHDLIPAQIAIRRILLCIGIYVTVFMILVPLTFTFFRLSRALGFPSLMLVTSFLLVVGAFFSLGPVIYAMMVQKSSLFREKNTSEITHEFKTPLAAIESAQMMIEDEMQNKTPNQKRLKDHMEMITRNVNRLERFVGSILSMNAVSGRRSPDSFHSFSLTQIVLDTLGDFPNDRHRIKINNHGDSEITGVPEGIRQIFSNILSNCVKYAPEGNIEISIHGDERKIDVSVRDYGTGIMKENLTKIFQPFFRIHQPAIKIRGSGLGLAIVKKWVDYHHGIIWAESEGLETGTLIQFSLPRA